MARKSSSKLRRISSSYARAHLADVLEAVGDRGERLLIERRGKAAVALVSTDDFTRLRLLEELSRTNARTKKTTRT